MSPDEQEALSHRYTRGVWCVPLSSGRIAAWTHPLGQFLGIFADFQSIPPQRNVAEPPRRKPVVPAGLDLSGIDL